MAARLGAPEVIRQLIEVGVEPDGLDKYTGSPLHFVGDEAQAETVDLLKQVFDIHQRPLNHRRSPFETYILTGMTRHRGHSYRRLDSAAWKSLIPLTMSSGAEDILDVWNFVLGTTPRERDDDSFNLCLLEVIPYLLSLGATRLYESKYQAPAYLAVSSSLLDLKGLREVRDWWRNVARSLGSPHPHFDVHTTYDLYRWSGTSLEWQRERKAIRDILHRVLQETTLLKESLGDPGTLTLLRECILYNDRSLLTILLDAGVDVHARVDGISAFEFACFPFTEPGDATLDLLFAHVDPRQLSTANPAFDGCGPLHFTAAAEVRYTGRRGRTMMSRLLELGASVDLPSTGKVGPPLVFHILTKSPDTTTILLESGANPWLASTSLGENAVMAALASYTGISLLESIVSVTERHGWKPQWDQKAVWTINGVTSDGMSALHAAVHARNTEAIKFLLTEGRLPDANVADGQGQTPMHWAAIHGHPRIIKLLHELGRGNVDAQSELGFTPLHCAVRNSQGSCVQTLLDLGAQQLPCLRGCTPLIYASGNADLVRLLVAADPDSRPYRGGMANLKGLQGLASALLMAIKSDDLDLCQRIVGPGCPMDVEMDLAERATPLMVAIVEPASADFVTWMFNNGASVSCVYQPPYGGAYHTVLDAACAQPSLHSVLPLLLRGFLNEGGDLLALPFNLLCLPLYADNIDLFETLMMVLETWEEEREPSLCVYPYPWHSVLACFRVVVHLKLTLQE